MLKEQYRLMYRQEDSYWWFLAKRRFVNLLLTKFCKNHKKLSILDVGSGTGGMTQYLRRWGNVKSIEPAIYAHPYLKKRKLSFSPKSFDQYPKKKKFDLVCFLDVLYHQNIANDKKEIKKAYSLLKPGGYLLIADCALPFLFGPHDRHMKARERYYLGDLRNKVISSGFKIQKASYIYFFVFPLFVITRMLQKLSGKAAITPVPKLINTLLLNICYLEAKLLNFVDYPIGSSVIILAKRN